MNSLALMHSPFSLAFRLHFIMLGEMSLWAVLRTAGKRIGMFPQCFVNMCDGVPLSCSVNPVCGRLGVSIYEVCCVLVIQTLLASWLWHCLGWMRLNGGYVVCAQKQSSNLGKKNPFTISLFIHIERKGDRFTSHSTFTLYWYQYGGPQRGILEVISYR